MLTYKVGVTIKYDVEYEVSSLDAKQSGKTPLSAMSTPSGKNENFQASASNDNVNVPFSVAVRSLTLWTANTWYGQTFSRILTNVMASL